MKLGHINCEFAKNVPSKCGQEDYVNAFGLAEKSIGFLKKKPDKSNDFMDLAGFLCNS